MPLSRNELSVFCIQFLQGQFSTNYILIFSTSYECKGNYILIFSASYECIVLLLQRYVKKK